MKIHQLYTNSPLRNFSYLVIGENNVAYCIDPYNSNQIINFISEYEAKNKVKIKLNAIINTHEHLDHTCGNDELFKKYHCEIMCHKNALKVIKNASKSLSEEDELTIDENSYFKVLNTPGHTFAHLCLVIVQNNSPYAIITGDTLFNAGIGNCYNGGDVEVLYETVKKHFYDLSDEVLIYPGHEYWENNLRFTLDREPENKTAHDMISKGKYKTNDGAFLVSTMSLERKVNVFFRINQKNIQTKLIQENLLEDTHLDVKQVFITLRKLRDQW